MTLIEVRYPGAAGLDDPIMAAAETLGAELIGAGMFMVGDLRRDMQFETADARADAVVAAIGDVIRSAGIPADDWDVYARDEDDYWDEHDGE